MLRGAARAGTTPAHRVSILYTIARAWLRQNENIEATGSIFMKTVFSGLQNFLKSQRSQKSQDVAYMLYLIRSDALGGPYSALQAHFKADGLWKGSTTHNATEREIWHCGKAETAFSGLF